MLSVGSWLAVYFVVWWTTLFAVLPFGARSQVEAGEVVPGSEPGAPARARMGRLFLMTTAAATIAFAIIYLLLNQTWFGLDDIPLLPRFDKAA